MVPEVCKKRVKNDILEDQGNNGFQGIDDRAINGGTWNKWNLGYLNERLFLDPIGYGNELKYGYFWVGGGSKNPRMNRHQIFRRTKGCLQAIYRKNAA